MKLIKFLNLTWFLFGQDFIHKQVHYFSNKFFFELVAFACCYATAFEAEGELEDGGVSCLRFQNEYNRLKIALRVVAILV